MGLLGVLSKMSGTTWRSRLEGRTSHGLVRLQDLILGLGAHGLPVEGNFPLGTTIPCPQFGIPVGPLTRRFLAVCLFAQCTEYYLYFSYLTE